MVITQTFRLVNIHTIFNINFTSLFRAELTGIQNLHGRFWTELLWKEITVFNFFYLKFRQKLNQNYCIILVRFYIIFVQVIF